jgi:hypothetical protein
VKRAFWTHFTSLIVRQMGLIICKTLAAVGIIWDLAGCQSNVFNPLNQAEQLD